jgi:hypothetical protein
LIDGKKLSCKGICEEKTRAIISLEELGEKSYSSVNKNWYLTPMFYLVFGSLFLFYGLSVMNKTMWFVYLGMPFIFFGLVNLYKGYKFKQSINKFQ